MDVFVFGEPLRKGGGLFSFLERATVAEIFLICTNVARTNVAWKNKKKFRPKFFSDPNFFSDPKFL